LATGHYVNNSIIKVTGQLASTLYLLAKANFHFSLLTALSGNRPRSAKTKTRTAPWVQHHVWRIKADSWML